MLKLAIITPSYISSDTRAQLAKRSLASLQQAVGQDWLHIVVDDVPRRSGLLGLLLPNSRYMEEAARIYNASNIRLIRQYGRNSVAATLRAVREARKEGYDLVFIHLDDNVYVPALGDLFRHAVDAFCRDTALMEVRLSGYPILSKACIPQLSNRTQINIADDLVSFDSVRLQSARHKDYTLWWSYFHDDMVDGEYWPIAMWLSIYRAEFLERLLTFDTVPELRWLGQVESYYKDKKNWRRALRRFGGKLGYVNMQFGGLEMQRNENWQQLIQLPNIPVR